MTTPSISISPPAIPATASGYSIRIGAAGRRLTLGQEGPDSWVVRWLRVDHAGIATITSTRYPSRPLAARGLVDVLVSTGTAEMADAYRRLRLQFTAWTAGRPGIRPRSRMAWAGMEAAAQEIARVAHDFGGAFREADHQMGDGRFRDQIAIPDWLLGALADLERGVSAEQCARAVMTEILER